MIRLYIPGLNIKTVFLLFALFMPGLVFSQSQKGKVLSGKTNTGIGYVNVGIIGRNIGTVSDESGGFTINLDKIDENDSLRFSMIGYESKTILVGNFKEDSAKIIYLNPSVYDLQEVKVISRKTRIREIILGNEVDYNVLKSGFSDNSLGSELAIKVHAKGPVRLQDLNLNVATCTFDSVTYRLNIYQSVSQTEFKNILTEPIYISFSRDKIKNALAFDLRRYSIIIEGNVLIALELYKDLGEGSLLFQTEFFTGSTYHRKTIEGRWIEAPGVIGMYLHGQLLK